VCKQIIRRARQTNFVRRAKDPRARRRRRLGLIDFAAKCCQFLFMTATMILKEIQALPVREKTKLFKRLEREVAEELDDLRLFDEAKREVAGQKPVPFRGAAKNSEAQLLQFIAGIGRKMRTTLTAKEMNAARLEGRK
jgi:hypothetical protein